MISLVIYYLGIFMYNDRVVFFRILEEFYLLYKRNFC